MRVTHFQRRPQPGQFSIERVFEAVRSRMPSDIQCHVRISHFRSRGIWRRLYNVVEAFLNQQDVNHVTGDVHFLTLLLSRKKTLLTVHDCVSLHRLKGLRRKVFYLFWYWLPVRRVCLISTVSESAKAELLEQVRCSPAKIRVVHDCVSEIFCKSPKEFNAKRPQILQIGTTKNKNLARVIDAVAEISCQLHIIGKLDPQTEDTLKQKGVDYLVSANLTNEGVVEAYCNCDLIAFVSTYEGFGLPIVEANAVGRPVVTSDLAPMRDVAGGAAHLVDPFDVKSIREGILRVINDQPYRESLVDRGYSNVERFGAQRIADQYADLYREIASS